MLRVYDDYDGDAYVGVDEVMSGCTYGVMSLLSWCLAIVICSLKRNYFVELKLSCLQVLRFLILRFYSLIRCLKHMFIVLPLCLDQLFYGKD